MALKVRAPSGAVPWPLVLLEGGEKLPSRFWEKVAEGQTILDTPCWVWTGANSGGNRPYGVTWNGSRRVKAHRWAWEMAYGAIPEGLELDHLCKTTLCVRPSHLECVTRAENVRRSSAPGPRAVRENTCKRGHEFTPENTFERAPRWRVCRTCRRSANSAYKKRKREAGKGKAA